MSGETHIGLGPWGTSDFWLLEQTVGSPEMMRHLGGAETHERMAQRQERFEQPGSGMFKIVDETTRKALGSVGFWERRWRSVDVYETGWFVLPGYQGRGIATAATGKLIQLVKEDGRRRFLHAFPAVENAPSNAICSKLGFVLIDECDFEYPPGNLMRCNDWRLELFDA